MKSVFQLVVDMFSRRESKDTYY